MTSIIYTTLHNLNYFGKISDIYLYNKDTILKFA